MNRSKVGAEQSAAATNLHHQGDGLLLAA